MRILIIVGARPNFIKIAPLMKEIKKYRQIESILVHTGQHYDFEMSQVFFQELKIPKPDYNLEVRSNSHAWQTAKIMLKLEPVVLKEKPDLIFVIGDVNSTLAGALVGAKLNIKIAHIEAGPRTYEKDMPEEINRVLVDHISDLLFCPTKISIENLKEEGIKKGVYNVGDIMYDSFLKNIKIALKKSKILEELRIKPKFYYLATVHRAENTNNKARLKNIVEAFCELGNIVFPCHPRTKKYLKKYKLWDKLNKKIEIIKPVKYLDMLLLEKNAKKILTDSGGIQKEAYWLKVPCITLMNNTGWPETVKDGWNTLTGTDKEKIIRAVQYFNPRGCHHNYYGKGESAFKIIEIILREYEK